MSKIGKEDIHIINRYSNWSAQRIESLLKKEVYNSKTSWQQFLRLFFISLGVSFTTTGILFFFAYNWADLHKFMKIGLIESLIIVTIGAVLFSKLSVTIKNIFLTAASILVGVLFAVFGQIYQTGANAYDFFLGWTLFITVWVVISNFAALWLLFIILINTTVILYSQQVAHDWSETFVFTLLFMMNSIFLLTTLFGKRIHKNINAPTWFTNTIALGTISISTLGTSYGIFAETEISFTILLLSSAILYILGVKYSLKIKRAFYLSIIAFSVISIITAFFVKISNDFGMFLFISLFLITSVTFVIKTLINLQKEWTK
jgi:uncharacterized membrane protein